MAGFNNPVGPSSNVDVIFPFVAIIDDSSTIGVLLPDLDECEVYPFEKVVSGSFA